MSNDNKFLYGTVQFILQEVPLLLSLPCKISKKPTRKKMATRILDLPPGFHAAIFSQQTKQKGDYL